MQDLDNIVNGQKLFLKPEYQEVLKNKKQFESATGATSPEKVAKLQNGQNLGIIEKRILQEKLSL